MRRTLMYTEEVLDKRGVLIQVIYYYDDGTTLKRKINPAQWKILSEILGIAEWNKEDKILVLSINITTDLLEEKWW